MQVSESDVSITDFNIEVPSTKHDGRVSTSENVAK